MAKLIPIILVLLGLAGGVGAGIVFKPKAEACEPTPEHACEEDAKAQVEDEVKHGPVEFAVLNRQFVIPLMRDGRVIALVVASLALEVAEGTGEAVYTLEPKLRDAFLQVMFVHAHVGGFDGSFTDQAALSDLKARLVEAADKIVGESLHDVLITEIVRQDL